MIESGEQSDERVGERGFEWIWVSGEKRELCGGLLFKVLEE